jgi:hypothetical protein
MNIIEIDGIDTVSISSTAEARANRDRLIGLAGTVALVSDQTQANVAANVLKEIKGMTRLIEAARTTVKAPVLEQGKKIDALAKELTFKLEAEATRIGMVLGTYQAEQERIAEEIRRKAWEEEQRILRAAQEAEEKAAAEARAKAAALALKESRARSEAKAADYAAQAEAAQLMADAEAEARQKQVEQEMLANRVNALSKIAAKPEGIATRKEIRFEIMDIVALYEAAPYLVTLTPNNAALKSALKGLQKGQSLPGVKHWEEAAVTVR